MKIEIIPYEVDHARNVLERNILQMGFELSQDDMDELANGWKKGGPAFTLIMDGIIVGCAGVILMGHGRGEAWSILSELFYKYKKTSYKAIKDGLNFIIEKEGLRRIQSMVFGGEKEKACGRFLEKLGFSWRGMLSEFGPRGEDIHMYMMKKE